jgi:cytoskeleton protein RodZ
LSDAFGTKLKRAREASGVALRDISLTTKISVAALEALERNDFSRLPGGIFSRAFIRSYANAVGLDPEATVQEFLAEVNRTENEAARVATERAAVSPEDRDFLERQTKAIRLLQIAGVLVVIAAGTGAAFAWMRWARPSDGTTSVSSAQPAPQPQPAAPPPAVSTPPVSPPTASPPPAGPPPAGPPPPAAPPATKPPPSADPKVGASGMPVTTVPAEEPPPVPVPPVPVEPLTIEFECISSCFVEIAADGKVSFSKAMEPGDRQRIQAQKELLLKVGDAGVFRWTLNGKRARPLGGAGAARSARVTQANFKKFIQ